MFNKYQTALEADDDTKKEAIDEFRDYLHDRYARELYEETATPLNVNFDDWADVQKEFQYYVSMYELIEQSGGCEEMDTQYMSGSDGDDWFNNMTQAGLISIKAMDTENINAEMGPLVNGGLSVIAILIGVFMDILELLVAFVQAYVFTMLSAVFIGLSRQKPAKE